MDNNVVLDHDTAMDYLSNMIQRCVEEGTKTDNFEIKIPKTPGPNSSSVTYVERAISEYVKIHGEAIAPSISRVLAELVLLGLPDEVMSHSTELVELDKRRLSQLNRQISDADKQYKHDFDTRRMTLARIQHDIEVAERTKKEYEDLLDRLEGQIKEHNGETVGAETDPALAGAKKAYDWIYQKTNDEAMAGKAFNSYLLGGRYQPGEKYDGDITEFDADRAIQVCADKAGDMTRKMRASRMPVV